MDFIKAATQGAKYGSKKIRDKLTRLTDAVGETDGKLNSPSDIAGIVNEYLAALPDKDRILADAEAAKAAGVGSPQRPGSLKRGFAAAERTAATADQLAAYIDQNFPKRLPKVDTSAYQPPEGLLNLRDLAVHPSESMGTEQRSLLLPVSNQFDFDEFTSRLTPERLKAMRTAAIAGGPIGGPYWYNMTPVFEQFVKVFGPGDGAARFRQWAAHNAALSPRSGVVDQTVRESQLNYIKNKTGEYPDNILLKDTPDMFGHIANDVHVKGMNRANEEGLTKTGDRPKVGSYHENYLGNWSPGTMDVHHFSIAGLSDPTWAPVKVLDRRTGTYYKKLGPDGQPILQQSWTPVAKFYSPLEIASMHMADRLGLDPAAFQASVWTGLAERPELLPMGKMFTPRTSAPYAAIFDEVIRESAKIRGITPEEMFRRAMNREDYLTRPPGRDKARSNRELAGDEGDLFGDAEEFAGGGLISGDIEMLRREGWGAADVFEDNDIVKAVTGKMADTGSMQIHPEYGTKRSLRDTIADIFQTQTFPRYATKQDMLDVINAMEPIPLEKMFEPYSKADGGLIDFDAIIKEYLDAA